MLNVREWGCLRNSFSLANVPQSRTLLLAMLLVMISVATASAGDLSGCWSGGWCSTKTGHKGPLQAQFVRQSDDSYVVHFSGKFFKIMPFKYTVVLNVVEEGDTVTLRGDSYLGRIFGWFHYEASATQSEFVANYSSCKDCGQFRLCRCTVCTPCTTNCAATCTTAAPSCTACTGGVASEVENEVESAIAIPQPVAE